MQATRAFNAFINGMRQGTLMKSEISHEVGKLPCVTLTSLIVNGKPEFDPLPYMKGGAHEGESVDVGIVLWADTVNVFRAKPIKRVLSSDVGDGVATITTTFEELPPKSSGDAEPR